MTWLYLPITSQPRELDAKLVLAHEARKAGLRPVIGYKSSFLTQLPLLEPGVFLAHNARQKIENLAQVRHFGNSVAVLDEESLVRQTDDIFWKKHRKDAFSNVDQILTWGENDAALWPSYGVDPRIGVNVVGNPRFDLLRPELAAYHSIDVAKLVARFGSYVLLNTNFPTVNNLTPQGGGVRIAKWAMDQTGQDLNDRFLAFKQANFEAQLALIAPLARAIAPLSLVVRPHPNEDHGPWRRVAQGLDNVHVVFEGNVVPWLLGAKALIHNNCTTGVEGVAAGKLVLNYVPFTSEFDNPLFHAFGTNCRDVEALAEGIKVSDRAESASQITQDRERLRRFVISVDGPLSAKRITETIISIGKDGLARPKRPARPARILAAIMTEAGRQARLASYNFTAKGRENRRFLAERFPQIKIQDLDIEQLRYSQEQLDLMMRQFPPLDLADIGSRLARLSAILGSESVYRVKPLRGALVEVV